MIRAMLWKEWREQRWRCVLGTLVMITLSGGLVRAQLVPTAESVLFIFGPVGLLLTIFLAMGSVATERADGTWAFLTAQPVRTATILRVKWLVGAAYLLVALLLAGMAAHLAAVSRGLFDAAPIPPIVTQGLEWMYLASNSALWLWRLVILASVAMLALYTVLFFALTRARTELHAGIAGLLLTIVVLAWLLQYTFALAEGAVSETARGVFWVSGLLNPLSPVAFVFVEPLAYQALAATIALVLWTAVPVWLVGHVKFRESWA